MPAAHACHRLRAGLERVSRELSLGAVRGQGLLIALDLGAPIAPAVEQTAFERGLLINAPQPALLRFMPALNVSATAIDEMLSVLHASLAVAQRRSRSQ